MIQIKIIHAIVAFMLVSSMPIYADDDSLDLSLDGKSFEGKLKVEKGFFRWITVKETITFKDGNFFWASGERGGYQPTPYKAKEIVGSVVFTVRSSREEGDYIDWIGTYDGESLKNVTAVWTRIEKDFVHDLLLPQKVTFTFKQKLLNFD